LQVAPAACGTAQVGGTVASAGVQNEPGLHGKS
jgi:hypothetical protein